MLLRLYFITYFSIFQAEYLNNCTRSLLRIEIPLFRDTISQKILSIRQHKKMILSEIHL